MKCKIRLALLGYLLTSSSFPLNWGYLVSQLWLELLAWPRCSYESNGTEGGGATMKQGSKVLRKPGFIYYKQMCTNYPHLTQREN